MGSGGKCVEEKRAPRSVPEAALAQLADKLNVGNE